MVDSPKPKYLDREMKSWKKAEYSMAKLLKGKRVKGSGNQVGHKGDNILPDYLVEVKSTDYKSMILHSEWLIKIENEARGCNRLPVIGINFNCIPAPFDKWVIMPAIDFAKLISASKDTK